MFAEPESLAQTLQCDRAAIDALPALAKPLLAWYGANARPLPWRDAPTPYHVWISEVMLQQTRVEAVKGYYYRFLAAFPSVSALAAAREDDLLKLWEGLGYYSRARNLQSAAREILRRFGGELPASYEQLRELPGIGEYTAGAIASIAFGIPVPAADGNVYRVLSRVLASRSDITRPPVRAALRSAAAALLPGVPPGDLNQALIELGALVCAPNKAPLCALCPLQEACAAYARGVALELPVKTGKKPRRMEERTILLITSPGGVLLFRRGKPGLLAGMWEPLNLDGHLDAAQAAEVVVGLGGAVLATTPLADAKHIFTHVEWRMRGFLIESSDFQTRGGVWASREALLDKYAIPSAFRAFFREAYGTQPR